MNGSKCRDSSNEKKWWEKTAFKAGGKKRLLKLVGKRRLLKRVGKICRTESLLCRLRSGALEGETNNNERNRQAGNIREENLGMAADSSFRSIKILNT